MFSVLCNPHQCLSRIFLPSLDEPHASKFLRYPNPLKTTKLLSVSMCVCVCASLVAQLHPALCDSMDQSGSSVHGILQAGVCSHSLLQGIFLIELRSPVLQADSLLSEPPRKP